MESHDQNFKNLINDYPVASIQFFAPTQAQAIDSNVSIIPVRQEQLKERLGDRFRELDTPLLVQWPDGRREAIVFLFEEESDVSKFSIRRTVHYCVDITDLLKTDRIVPVVIFLRTGNYQTELNLGTENITFLQFRYIVCDLGRLNADNFLTSQNIVARLNLPLMSYNPERKVEIYSHAMEGLIDLEPRHNYRVKYIDYIDAYANLSEDEFELYETEFAPRTRKKEDVMGLLQHSHDKGMQQGVHKGEAITLRRLVTKKFGSVPKSVEERIEKANSDTLLEWSENVLSAETVEDVFH